MTVSSSTIGSIPSYFNGFSYEKTQSATSTFTGWNSNLIALYTRLSDGVIRFGDYTVDRNVWNASGPGGQGSNTSGTIAQPDVNRVRDFLTATGFKCIWGVNLHGSTTPALAADKAAYVYSELVSSLLAIEIGNEPDSYGMTQSAFATLWKQYRDAIVAQSPGIPIYAPVSATVAWADWFAQSSGYGNLVQGISQHYYRANSQTRSATIGNIVNPEPNSFPATVLSDLQNDVSSLGIPFRIAECNSAVDGGTEGVSDAYASALWSVDYLFQVAKSGSAGVNFHGGSSSMVYTPIAVANGGTVGSVCPLYYGMYMFQMLDTGAILSTSFSGNNYTRAYAVKGSNLKIMVVNTDSSHNLALTINIFQTAKAANFIAMTQLSSGASGPSLSATDGVMIRGTEVGTDGSFSPHNACIRSDLQRQSGFLLHPVPHSMPHQRDALITVAGASRERHLRSGYSSAPQQG